MFKVLKITFLILFLNINHAFSLEECNVNSDLKIGLINNNFIDYQYYFYYELGNYAQIENIEFELNVVQNNIDDFDIIFGEWNALKKLNLNDIFYPKEIEKFYYENGIKIKKNILPLDLDTFLIISKQNKSNLNFKQLSSFYDPNRYSFGMSFSGNDSLIRLLSFINQTEYINFDSHSFESTIATFKKLYRNSNKNILSADYNEVYNSFENNENVFTLFSDGILLYKNLDYKNYDIFPQNYYSWEEELGIFIENNNPKPFSFFGLSAYINNIDQIGFICHLLKEEVRANSFQNFNLQISPLSENELKNLNDVPKNYQELLSLKNQHIFELDNFFVINNFDLIEDLVTEKKQIIELISKRDHLN